jgi:electron transfer flavoprotein beta subunit
MKIVVFTRYAPEPNTVELIADSGRLDYERILFKLGRADLIALEMAVRLKEQYGGSIAAFCVAPPAADKLLRTLYAGGADEVTRLWNNSDENLAEFAQARLIADAVKAGGYDLIIGGAVGSEGNSDVIGGAVAGFLGLPQAGNVALVEKREDKLYLERKLEKGEREALLCALPAVITIAEGSLEPRYPSMPQYVNSLRRPLNLAKAELFSTNVEIKYFTLTPPRPRPKKIPRPDDNLPSHKRIEAILAVTGGDKKGNIFEGSAEEMAEKIAAFLESNKFI